MGKIHIFAKNNEQNHALPLEMGKLRAPKKELVTIVTSMRFIGEYLAKTDAKGRVFFPAAFRKVVDTKGAPQSFVLRSDLFQKCLVLYPEAVWNSRLDEMQARMNHWNGEHQDMLRRFVAGVEMQELDKSGRLLLTKRKLQVAGITDEVRFVGMDDRIEIWNPSRFDEYLNDGGGSLGADLQRCMADDPQSPPPAPLMGREEREA